MKNKEILNTIMVLQGELEQLVSEGYRTEKESVSIFMVSDNSVKDGCRKTLEIKLC